MTLNAFCPAMSCPPWSGRKILTLDENGRARHRSLPKKQLIRTLSIICGTAPTYEVRLQFVVVGYKRRALGDQGLAEITCRGRNYIFGDGVKNVLHCW